MDSLLRFKMNRLDKKNFYQFPKYGFENILHENHFHPNQLNAKKIIFQLIKTKK